MLFSIPSAIHWTDYSWRSPLQVVLEERERRSTERLVSKTSYESTGYLIENTLVHDLTTRNRHAGV